MSNNIPHPHQLNLPRSTQDLPSEPETEEEGEDDDGSSFDDGNNDTVRSPLLGLSNKRDSISITRSPELRAASGRRPSLPAHRLSRTKSSQSHVQPSSTASSTTEKYKNYKWLSNTGSEPGVNVNEPPGRYSELVDEVSVTVVDYASDGSASRVDLPGAVLGEWLEGEDGRREVSPDTTGAGEEKAGGKGKSGVRKSVRWINVDGEGVVGSGSEAVRRPNSIAVFSLLGINFQTIKTLALTYNLHPLAIEDALRAGNNPRSKIDFYAEHLYTQVSRPVRV
jgi:hypothetical protein